MTRLGQLVELLQEQIHEQPDAAVRKRAVHYLSDQVAAVAGLACSCGSR